jgi:DNA-binding response OmpR family regulator
VKRRTEDGGQQWRNRLTPEQYRVLRQKRTERPCSGRYVHSDEEGVYRCAACGAELFSSAAKFDSGTGWPSFTVPVRDDSVELVVYGSGERTVLVVDDEPMIAEVVARYLERAGYRVLSAADGEEALDVDAVERPDLVVLDVMLPRLGGLEVMRRLRARAGGGPPVVLLTAKGEESDRLSGLRLGADDYVVKPFSAAELVARVDAVLRRAERLVEPDAMIELPGLSINPVARRVHVRGEEIQLTQREYDLLLFLARHPGRAFSRHELIRAIWRYSFYSDTSTVTVHIRRLRTKIEDDPGDPRYLQTVRGVGYRLES